MKCLSLGVGVDEGAARAGGTSVQAKRCVHDELYGVHDEMVLKSGHR